MMWEFKVKTTTNQTIPHLNVTSGAADKLYLFSTSEVAQGDSLACSWLVGWLSATTMCNSSLIYLLDLGEVMEEVMGGPVNCRLPSGLSPGLEGKWWGTI
jgi:hypothetical protein